MRRVCVFEKPFLSPWQKVFAKTLFVSKNIPTFASPFATHAVGWQRKTIYIIDNQ
jgi:hypothetical protein